ncbi:MAG: bifunctional UDP-N-acetylglucosamine diphosphorylase/glucosamine-1-phosphate N-acetyltransferase GlmU, partial [Deltaproteobacteria bacterium]|nr:bifunctional UDP-N-acetylglucosamine diphosphorylase/glucosamine-1-phosphate N-acetyltransferase GlmU [Deltaproteobacteria bacterium]
MDNLVTVVLAAGKGTRMKSDRVKVMHAVAGLPMLAYPIRSARALGCDRIVAVVGHQREAVEEAFQEQDIGFVCQEEQLGSGHAVMVTESELAGFTGDVLILCGDVPLIREETLSAFVAEHRDKDACVSVLSVVLDDPTGYGRMIRDADGNFLKIVEHRDAGDDELAVQEINTGIYCCSAPFLYAALKQVGTDNDQGEYYLPDIISIAVRDGKAVQAIITPDFEEVRGINDRVGLAAAEKMMRRRVLEQHMHNGVTIIDPDSTYIEADVQIGRDCMIYPNTTLRAETRIGEGCVVDINCCVTNSVIGNNVHIKSSCVIDESTVGDRAVIGPFAHLRPLTELADDAKVGNYVEIKKARIGKGSKVNHLTYIGDATIGTGANIGAGTITCNYDGKNKHQTVIGDGAFIGSNTALVAPVTIGSRA